MMRRKFVDLGLALLLSGLVSQGRVVLAQEADPNAAAQPQAGPRVDPAMIQKLKERFDQEPSVKEVQKAALMFFKVNPERVASYRAGAQWKSLVPDVEFGLNTERGDTLRRLTDYLLDVTHYPYKESENTGHSNYSLSFRAHWALDRLVFNAEVLDVTSLVGVQEGLLREITALYFTRRRLVTMFALNPPQDPGEQITESIRLDEITANLDALTGGWFSDAVESRTGE